MNNDPLGDLMLVFNNKVGNKIFKAKFSVVFFVYEYCNKIKINCIEYLADLITSKVNNM